MLKRILNLIGLVAICVFFVAMWTHMLLENRELINIDSDTYRAHQIGEVALEELKTKKNPGEFAALYLLDKARTENFQNYLDVTESIWNDVVYFPVAEFVSDASLHVEYEDSWYHERTYGGTRKHEGTDIMPGKNLRGVYPIVSMTDGIVAKKGWLDKGGYRIGIETERGAYFYYAHLDSYASVEVGDKIKAGDILGFMGDSGYGEEGTTGKFPVHLHVGIYIYPDGKEVSVNPYWILRYIEKRTVKCYTEISCNVEENHEFTDKI